MAEFTLKVDTVFDADDLEGACFKIIAHFMRVADIQPHDIDSCSLRPAFLEHVGSFSLVKEQP